MVADHTLAIFVAELIFLLAIGRLFGEAMSRLGQPAIFGQLPAGVVLGTSVFGALLPEVR
jgi:Kef-type K+ transport system membrane component KefB